MHQRNKTTSIFRHLVGMGLSALLPMALPLVRCQMLSKIYVPVITASRNAREACPPVRQWQLKIRLYLIFRLTWPHCSNSSCLPIGLLDLHQISKPLNFHFKLDYATPTKLLQNYFCQTSRTLARFSTNARFSQWLHQSHLKCTVITLKGASIFGSFPFVPLSLVGVYYFIICIV